MRWGLLIGKLLAGVRIGERARKFTFSRTYQINREKGGPLCNVVRVELSFQREQLSVPGVA